MHQKKREKIQWLNTAESTSQYQSGLLIKASSMINRQDDNMYVCIQDDNMSVIVYNLQSCYFLYYENGK